MSITGKGTTRFQMSYGQLQTDKYGLSTATANWFDRADRPTLPGIGAGHPIWSELMIERFRVNHLQTHWEIEADYAGLFGTPEAVYELDASGTEEPIETHPNFATFAGTAADVNATTTGNAKGALFDADHSFFVAFVSGTKRGVRAYICPGSVWRKTVIQADVPNGMGNVGSIQQPEGNYPSTPSGRTWLFMGMTYEQRGGAFTVRKEWKLSGRRGWDTDIYV